MEEEEEERRAPTAATEFRNMVHLLFGNRCCPLNKYHRINSFICLSTDESVR